MRWSPLLLLALLACRPSPPSDDPADYEVDTSLEYAPVLSAPRQIAPGPGLPAGLALGASNNNVAIEHFDDRLFFAWRTSETHFASPNTLLHIVSTDADTFTLDADVEWTHEHTVELGADAREPMLYVDDDTLFFAFFEAGTSTFSFAPRHVWRIERTAEGAWTEPEEWLEPGTVIWDLKKRRRPGEAEGRNYLTHYLGNHYGAGDSAISLRFSTTEDGREWTPVKGEDAEVYYGGASEAAWELDEEGGLWAVLRNEDGDDTGFGGLLCSAPPSDLTAWSCNDESQPRRFDSPKMLRHGDDLYLVARRNLGEPFDQGRDELSLEERRRLYAIDYWNTPKRTALYKIDREARVVEHLLDLPSAGDTAFPSIRRTGAHTFLIANYSSPVDDPDRSWLEGQGAEDGTQIYLIELRFEPSAE